MSPRYATTKNVHVVRSLGADRVIDYTAEDFTRNGQVYDVIYDVVGKHSFRRCKGSLKPGGIYLATDGWPNVARSLLLSRTRLKRAVLPVGGYKKKDVLYLKRLIEAGEYHAVTDRSYPLEQVIDATRYAETQQKTGNVVLTVDP
jgi:NADPH:quinone reductase-like Zn-dependent oxidoreductase